MRKSLWGVKNLIEDEKLHIDFGRWFWEIPSQMVWKKKKNKRNEKYRGSAWLRVLIAEGFLWWSGGWESACLAGDTGSMPGLGRFRVPGAAKSVRGNYWVHVPQALRTVCLRAGAPRQERPPQWEAHALQWRVAPPALEKALMEHWRPSTSKNQLINFKRGSKAQRKRME